MRDLVTPHAYSVAPIEEILGQKFGVRLDRPDILRVLGALPTIRRSAVALPGAEAALYDGAGFVEGDDAYRGQMLSNVADYARLMATALTTEETRRKLHVDRSRVRQRIAERTLWAIKDSGKWVLPAVQFDDNGLVRGLDQIIRLVPAGMHPLSVLGLLTSPQPELGEAGEPVSIVHWLRTGGDITTAVAVMERSDWAGI